jgi:predicted DNA-binding transcriptional regulator AlpA
MGEVAEKLLSVKGVAEIVGVSERQIWRLAADNKFPQPVHVGHSARWVSSDIQTYLEKLKRGRND